MQMRMRNIVLSFVACPVLARFRIISQTARFPEKKKSYWTQNVRFEFLYNFLGKIFSFQEEFREILLKMYIALHVQYQSFYPH